MKTCGNCGKEIDPHINYCNWDCMVELSRKQGCVEHLPNGLPPASMKADGTLLEHEHGDHPDYKFPVIVEYIGPEPEKHFGYTDGAGNDVDMVEHFGPDWLNSHKFETHALIYSNSTIAVTMYECCFAMWNIARHGELVGSFMLWKEKEWKMTPQSVRKIWELHEHS